MQSHIFRPIPSLETLPQPATREERLKTIIANLDKHDHDVRASILREARQKLHQSLAEVRSTPMTTKIAGFVDHDTDIARVEAEEHERVLANLNAPHSDPSTDPCLPPLRTVISSSTTVQARLPLEVRVTLEALEQVQRYEEHAKITREYYVRALERQNLASTVGGRRGSSGGGGGGGIGGGEMGGDAGGKGRAYEERDPRRR